MNKKTDLIISALGFFILCTSFIWHQQSLSNNRFVYKCIFFEKNSSVYISTSESDSLLEEVIQFMDDHGNFNLLISGHSDIHEGDDTLLSYSRAITIRNLMINLGVNQSRLEVKAYGNSKPIAISNDDKGKEIVNGNLNRRVDFKLISK